MTVYGNYGNILYTFDIVYFFTTLHLSLQSVHYYCYYSILISISCLRCFRPLIQPHYLRFPMRLLYLLTPMSIMTEKGMLATRRDDPKPTISWDILIFSSTMCLSNTHTAWLFQHRSSQIRAIQGQDGRSRIPDAVFPRCRSDVSIGVSPGIITVNKVYSRRIG
jgi:hypothetical protein